MKKKILVFAIVILMVASVFSGCAAPKKAITLATTTSTQDSGLLDYLLPLFTKDTGYEVKVVAVGTGQAIQIGQKGDADVLLVHSKADEEKFVADGYGEKRIPLMYNDFILVGPDNDKSKELKGTDIKAALQKINDGNLGFISRGDDSGTDKFEKKLWKAMNIQPAFSNYKSAGQGMGPVLTMASEKQAYTITDRATYLSMKDKLSLAIIVEGSAELKNQYGIIAVSKEKFPSINYEGAKAFIDWMTSDKGLQLISDYGKDKYGQKLFTPDFVK
ncbi:MAG: substrate-binding domain-containing protein [Eubacteriales bacterium]